METHFGEHLTLDGYGGDTELLNNSELVSKCLDELCHVLEMHKLGKPHLYQAPGNQIKDPGGWSTFVVIAESHIAIHTFPKRRFLSADVYTCRNGLDIAKIITFFKEKFSLEDVETNFIKRGLKYPEHNLV